MLLQISWLDTISKILLWQKTNELKAEEKIKKMLEMNRTLIAETIKLHH